MDMQWHPEAGVPPPSPEDSHQMLSCAFPSIPSLHTSHRQPVLLLQCLTGCWSHCRGEEDLPPSFTKSLLEQNGGRKGQKKFTPCSCQAALVSCPTGWGPGSCPGAVSCWPAHICSLVLQGEGLNSKGASTQWPGTRLEGWSGLEKQKELH